MKKVKLVNLKQVEEKRVLLRVDLNVPLENGKVLDDYKLLRVSPTIKKLVKNNAKVILISHLGRPKPGQDNSKYSLGLLAEHLSKLCGIKINFVPDICGFTAITATAKMKPGEVIMLENVRFEANEKKNSKKFAQKLAKLGQIYINDAFAVSHRADASLSAIKNYLPSYAGFLLAEEVNNLEKVSQKDKKLVVIIGGAKLETKIPIIKNFKNLAEHIIIGGAVANNFLKAKGYEIGRSLIDSEGVRIAAKIKQKNLVFPMDLVLGNKKRGWTARASALDGVGKSDYIFDIGPKSIKLFGSLIKQAETIVWNGPMGYFEEKQFRFGTLSIARIVAARSKGRAFGLVGGGETVEALRLTKMQNGVDWVSTGGGAMLNYLGNKKMPGLKKIVSGF